MEINAGRITGQRYILAVDGAKTHAFSGKLTGALISSLPIAVSGLNDGWSCYLYDRIRKAARPLAVFEGTGWATVSLNDTQDLFLGHPITADNPLVHIQVTQAAENKWKVEVHNPTDRPIRTTISKNPHFDPLRHNPFTGETLTVPAGSSIWREL